MALPSRLKEQPIGNTSPDTPFRHPSCSSLRSAPGSAGSDDDVPSTISSSSLKQRMVFHRLKPFSRASVPSTTTTKNECGIMCSTKSAKPDTPACLVNFAATDGSSVPTDTCLPTPG